MKATRRQLASVLGLTERRIQQLVSEGKLPGAIKGKFDLCKSVQGYVATVRARRDRPTLVQARLEKLEVETEIARLERDEKKAHLVPLDELMPRMEKFCRSARAHLYNEPELSDDAKDRILTALGGLMTEALVDEQPESDETEQTETDTEA